VPSPVPKYTTMAIHMASPVYSHFSILGHPVYSLNQQFILPALGIEPRTADNRFRLSAHCANEPQRQANAIAFFECNTVFTEMYVRMDYSLSLGVVMYSLCTLKIESLINTVCFPF